jgi:hypothetical protein
MQTLAAWALPLQLWGGLFYLLHKVFCSRYERTKKFDLIAAQRWRTRSWMVYMTGLPVVVLMLLAKENWIFAALEASALPVMLLGLILAMQGKAKQQIDQLLGQLDPIVYTLIGFGLGYSFCYFGGFVTFNQWLEIGASGGFLVGTYLQAKDDERQYLAYMLMNLSAGTLLWREDYVWFTLQQIISIAFVIDAWLVRRSTRPALAS